jgi:hypothetical protein
MAKKASKTAKSSKPNKASKPVKPATPSPAKRGSAPARRRSTSAGKGVASASSANAAVAPATATRAITAPAGQSVVCAGYSLKVANLFGVVTDDFNLQALDAQQNRYVAQGSILDKRSVTLLQRIAQANGGVGWTFLAANGVIIG